MDAARANADREHREQCAAMALAVRAEVDALKRYIQE